MMIINNECVCTIYEKKSKVGAKLKSEKSICK